jgi:hypothetical protein
MDPEQALVDARAACDHWHNGERGERGDRGDRDLDAFDELVNAFEALDQWLSRGGFLPQDWRRVTR